MSSATVSVASIVATVGLSLVVLVAVVYLSGWVDGDDS